MNITKDEAKILAQIMEDGKYDLNHSLHHLTKEKANEGIQALTKLQEKLEFFGQDERRRGRTSSDSFGDVWKRFVKKQLANQKNVDTQDLIKQSYSFKK